MKKLSYLLNIIFFTFICWYFLLHVGVGVYYQKYFEPESAVFTDIYYNAKISLYTGLNLHLPANTQYDVFIGDSLIEQFPVQELFSGRNILNRGIGFDTSAGILKRLAVHINNIPVAHCFVLIGHNDLKYRSVHETVHNIELIMTRIKADKIYFLSIPPCSDDNYNHGIGQINDAVLSLSKRLNFCFIDCNELLVTKTGSINPEYFYDGVHLTIDGYLKLKECITAFLSSS